MTETTDAIETPQKIPTRNALIVDDNELLAYFTAKNLERDVPNLSTQSAASCEEARLKAAAMSPDILVVDFRLGEDNGLDLIEELTGSYPGALSILISGSPVPNARLGGLFGFLLKPYDAVNLAEMVRKALDSKEVNFEPHPAPEPLKCGGYNRHKIENHLGVLLAGLRAFGSEIRICASDPVAVEQVVETHLDQLCDQVLAVSKLLPSCPGAEMELHSTPQPPTVEESDRES